MTVSRTGSTATPFGFVGAAQYQTDADSGLQLLGHRMYDPSVGRFISSDPAKAGDNWYAYTGNHPTSSIDPLGLWETGSYLGYVGQVLKGYGDALNPVNWWNGFVGAVGEIDQNGLRGVGNVGGAMLKGMVFWDQPTLRQAGGSIMGDLIVAAPILKRIPGLPASGTWIPVARWGRPGLLPGDWVMIGRANRWNYIRSFKWQPGMGNAFTPFEAGEEFRVPPSSVKWPTGGGIYGAWKGIFGQRKYMP